MSKVCEFEGACGYNSFATGKLVPGGVVSLNGKQDLSECMAGKSEARAYEIRLSEIAGVIYSYRVEVDCQGPAGTFSGSWHLKIEDEDIYTLGIFDSSRKTHEVSFSSDSPNIVKIMWHN